MCVTNQKHPPPPTSRPTNNRRELGRRANWQVEGGGRLSMDAPPPHEIRCVRACRGAVGTGRGGSRKTIGCADARFCFPSRACVRARIIHLLAQTLAACVRAKVRVSRFCSSTPETPRAIEHTHTRARILLCEREIVVGGGLKGVSAH